MKFDSAFNAFLKEQIRTASGRRLERLQKELVGEKKMFREVLWPVFQSFEGFTLEYELKTATGISIFIDTLYHPLAFGFESEGFVPHAENITRDRFAFERGRIRTMVLNGIKYIPFSWDELESRPETCRRSIYELLGRFTGSDDRALKELNVYEREIIRYAMRLQRSFGLTDACYCLQLGPEAARRVLRGLLEKGLIVALGKGRKSIRAYALDKRAFDYML